MELWSDLDKNADNGSMQDATHPLQVARHGRTRRLSEQLVFSTLRTWLLDEYVPSYSHALAMTRIYRHCYWLDALGTTKATGTAELLQTVRTLADTLAQESRPITLHGLLFEQGSSTRRDSHSQHQVVQDDGELVPSSKARRKSSTKREIHLPKSSSTLHTSWLAAANSVLPQIEQAPTIFLLNPFGQTMFTADNLTVLYRRTAPTELCLLLPHKQVETLLLIAMRSPAYAIALNGVLRTDKWKTLDVQDEERRAQAVNEVIALFVKAMQRYFVLPVQRIILPINIHPVVVEAIPYTLLFATRRQDSFVSMNDALCRYHRSVYDQSHRGVLAEEWFAAQQQARREEQRVQLLDYIQQCGKTQRVRRWPELRQQVLLDHFGQFLLSEYDVAIQTLITQRAVVCEWRHTSTNGEGNEPVPGNDDVLVW